MQADVYVKKIIFVYASFYNIIICMKVCIEQNQMMDCMYTIYVLYPVVAMPVILHSICIIHGMYDNNEVHCHEFPCVLPLLPLVSYFIVLTNVNLVYSKRGFIFIIDNLK